MKLAFTKLEGTGNDFILFDGLGTPLPPDLGARTPLLCDRHRGIGADGVLLVEPAPGAMARMRVLNPDGSEPEMCGNGLRCVARYLRDHHGLVDGQVHTGAGLLDIRWVGNEVRLTMGAPRLARDEIPVHLDGDGPMLDEALVVGDRSFLVSAVSMGNPHAVVFEALDEADFQHYGPLLMRHEAFPRHANVEFVEVRDPAHARVRVWERGAGPTQACGTGAAAVLVAGVLTGRLGREALLELPGGTLQVGWDQGHEVELQGPAREVYQGVLTLPGP